MTTIFKNIVTTDSPRNMITLDSDNGVIGSFLIDQRAHIETEIYYKKYPNISYSNFLFVDTSASEWADVVARRLMDARGEPKWGSTTNNDIPRVDVDTAMQSLLIYERELGYYYHKAEIVRAAQTGINLDSERAVTVRDVFERDLNTIGLFGNKEKKMDGFFNAPGITRAEAGTSIRNMIKDISVTSGIQALVNFFQSAIDKVHLTQTNTIYRPDFIGICQRDYNLLKSTVIPGGGTNTILPFLESNLNIKFIPEQLLQKSADVAPGDKINNPLLKDRMIIGRRDKTCGRFHLPMPLKFGMPYTNNGGKRWDTDGMIRTGGTEIRIPKAFHYIDFEPYAP